MFIYLVWVNWGDYDSYEFKFIKAFTDKQKVEEYAEKLQEQYDEEKRQERWPGSMDEKYVNVAEIEAEF